MGRAWGQSVRPVRAHLASSLLPRRYPFPVLLDERPGQVVGQRGGGRAWTGGAQTTRVEGLHAVERGAVQGGVLQLGVEQEGAAQDSGGEVGAREIRAAEIGAAIMKPVADICAPEIGMLILLCETTNSTSEMPKVATTQ